MAEIVEHIYEAAVIPERWGDALRGLAEMSGACAASLLVFNEAAPPSTVHYNCPREVVERYTTDLWEGSAATRWGLSARPSDFSSFRDNIAETELLTDPAVTMLYELGITDSVVSVNPLSSGQMLGLMLNTSNPRGHFDQNQLGYLNAMRPHLLRSGLIAAKLGLKRAQTMVETMERLGLAAGVVDSRGRVIAVNELLEALPTVLVPTAFGGIAINEKLANKKFNDALRANYEHEAKASVSIPVGPLPETPPLIIHLLPICGNARDIFAAGHILLVVARIEPKAAPQSDLLNGLFDLTPAEARLVRELVAGGSLPQVAKRLGLSVHTLRAQLRSVTMKTGVRRQGELLQLLAAI